MKSVIYQVRTPISSSCGACECSECEGIICLIDGLSLSGFIEATIAKPIKDCNSLYTYVISYDEDQLIDSDYTLVPTDITGAICRDCLFTYIDYYLSNGGPVTPVINIPALSIEFGDLANAYTALTFLDAQGKAKVINVDNNTNADVQLSYDGLEDGPIVEANSFRQLEFGANAGLLVSTDIYAKYLGDAPSTGSLNLDGFY